MKTRIATLVIVVFSLIASASKAQSHLDSLSPKALYDTIARLDSAVFSILNAHKVENVASGKNLFTADLEFYHDTGGLTGFTQTMNFFKSTAESGSDLRRELVPGTMEVYPIPGFGAMQIGEHRFCHTENSKLNCGTFKFVHIWKWENGYWKISRVVSYGH